MPSRNGALVRKLRVPSDDDRYRLLHRTRVRIAGPYLALMLPILALQIARFPQEVDFSHPRIYSGIVMLGLMSLAGIYLSLGDWRKTMG